MVTSFSSDFLFLANFHLFQRSDIPHFLQLSSNKWDWKKKSLFALPGLSRSLVPTRMQVKQCLHVQRPGLFHRPHLGQRPSLCHLWKMSSHTQRLTREIQQRYIPRKQITHETVLLEKVLVSKVYLLIVTLSWAPVFLWADRITFLTSEKVWLVFVIPLEKLHKLWCPIGQFLTEYFYDLFTSPYIYMRFI